MSARKHLQIHLKTHKHPQNRFIFFTYLRVLWTPTDVFSALSYRVIHDDCVTVTSGENGGFGQFYRFVPKDLGVCMTDVVSQLSQIAE